MQPANLFREKAQHRLRRGTHGLKDGFAAGIVLGWQEKDFSQQQGQPLAKIGFIQPAMNHFLAGQGFLRRRQTAVRVLCNVCQRFGTIRYFAPV